MHTHVLPAGTTGRAPLAVDVSPESANWTYSGLKIAVLGAGESYALATGDSECLVLPLEGAATVAVGGATFELKGRFTIFGEVTDEASRKVVDEIAQVSTGYGDKPVEPVVIESVTVA